MTGIIIEFTLSSQKEDKTIDLAKQNLLQKDFDDYKSGKKKDFEIRVMNGTDICKIRISD